MNRSKIREEVLEEIRAQTPAKLAEMRRCMARILAGKCPMEPLDPAPRPRPAITVAICIVRPAKVPARARGKRPARKRGSR